MRLGLWLGATRSDTEVSINGRPSTDGSRVDLNYPIFSATSCTARALGQPGIISISN